MCGYIFNLQSDIYWYIKQRILKGRNEVSAGYIVYRNGVLIETFFDRSCVAVSDNSVWTAQAIMVRNQGILYWIKLHCRPRWCTLITNTRVSPLGNTQQPLVFICEFVWLRAHQDSLWRKFDLYIDVTNIYEVIILLFLRQVNWIKSQICHCHCNSVCTSWCWTSSAIRWYNIDCVGQIFMYRCMLCQRNVCFRICAVIVYIYS